MSLPTLNPGEFPHFVKIMMDSSDPSVVSRALPLVEFVELWAKIDHEQVPSNTSGFNGQDTSKLLAKISVPYVEGISAHMQVHTLNGNVYLITDLVNVKNMNVLLHLHCTMIGPNTQ